MATIKEQFELNTENVNLATELLKVLSDRAGQYVWKRVVTETTEVSVTNPSFSIVGDNNTGWTITEASFDHTQVTLDFFDGFTSSDGRIVFAKNSGKVQLKAVGYQGTSLTYNPSTGFFQNNTPSSDGTFTVSYTGTKTYTTETKIVDYVVADDEAAYPDGAEQDGYWYELAEEGVSGIDFGEVIFTSILTTSFVIQHGLGVIPSHVMLFNCDGYRTTKTTGILYPAYAYNTTADSVAYSLMFKSSPDVLQTQITTSVDGFLELNDAEVTFKVRNTMYPYYGKYKWIVIA